MAPIAISASHIHPRTFVLLNAISAAVWGVIKVWAGYLFGEAVDPWLRTIKSATLVIVGVGAIFLIVALSPRIRRRWREWRGYRSASS